MRGCRSEHISGEEIWTVGSGWLGDIALLSQETMQRGGHGACVREPQGGEATGRKSQ